MAARASSLALRAVSAARTFLERFAPGAAVVREFGDAGLSGSSMIRRRDLQALLRAARAREADAVITESLDRLSRSQADIATILRRSAARGSVS